ncbi:MAG: tryptophan synthase subunit alpha [Chloroflexota bacterium]|nr:tryptophan synthase subunit alpha [Chloroflexota bacterium]
MNGIARAFARARAEDRAALIPYVMAGYPAPDAVPEIALALERGGADLLEIGMPFSDPLADGPTIQRAATTSLAGGTTVAACIETASRIRQRSAIPMVLMGYFNPIHRYGLARFFTDAAGAGVGGLIVPDLPPEEAGEVRAIARQHGIDLIFLLAPTSTEERIRRAAAVASGFVYCVSLTGVTGARASVAEGLEAFLGRVRRHTSLPLAVGFGISRPAHARQVAQVADGVVVASALIDLIDKTEPKARLRSLEEYMRSMHDGAGKSMPLPAGAVSGQQADDRVG